MKIKYPSTLDEPLNFFRNSYNKDAILEWFSSEYSKVVTLDYPYYKIIKDQEGLSNIRIEYMIDTDEGQTIFKTTLSSAFSRIVNQQYSLSISLIHQNVLNQLKDSKKIENLLEFYLKEAKMIEDSSNEVINELPFLLIPLIKIQNYINKRYLNGSIRPINLSNGGQENYYSIIEIFSYLSGLNDEGTEIMSDNDYQRLISFVTHYLEIEGILEFGKKIPPLNEIDNLTLRRTFYTFWKTFKGLRNCERSHMALLLITTFEQFNESRPEVITQALTKKPRYWKKCVPEIVKV